MALFAKPVRDVISILSIILNQQDLHATRVLAMVQPFDASAGEERDYRRLDYKIPM
jgi:hypothetical protein